MTAEAPKQPTPRNPVPDMLRNSFKVFAEYRPLALGIHKTIRERLPEINAQQLRNALRMHTASTRYLKALTQGDTRYDLDGAPAGEITAEQRQQASETLRDRFKKKAELQKQQRLALEQEKQRQEKLLKLAEKFGKSR
jgi:ProP effector